MAHVTSGQGQKKTGRTEAWFQGSGFGAPSILGFRD